MSLLTSADGDAATTYTRQKEIRALAVQAAATLHAGIERETPAMSQGERENIANRTLMTARYFEQYIEDGTWPHDPEAEVKS